MLPCIILTSLPHTVTWRTVRSYLAALRFYQIRAGLPDPSLSSFPAALILLRAGLPDPSLSSFPQLTYVLKGIHRRTPDYQRRRRLPITRDLLLALHRVWSTPPVQYEQVMLWAACCTGFFGFLRAGEFTCSPADVTDPPLAVSDIAVDSRENPRLVTVHLRQSKTDPFGVGCHVFLGRTNTTPCPVAAILNYLAARPTAPGPLFIFADGTPLSRPVLVSRLREALARAGVDSRHFAGHSFRIGAATAAAQAGYSDSFIQSLGRWQSSAFTAYIRTPPHHLVSVAPTLAGVRLLSPRPSQLS